MIRPKVEYNGTLELLHVTTVVDHEQECLAHFFYMWKNLAPCLQDMFFSEITWSKEVYDLLEAALRSLQQLQNQLDDIYHDIHIFLDPQKTSRIQSTRVAPRVTGTGVKISRHATQPGLRRRNYGMVEGSSETSDLQSFGSLLDERKKMK